MSLILAESWDSYAHSGAPLYQYTSGSIPLGPWVATNTLATGNFSGPAIGRHGQCCICYYDDSTATYTLETADQDDLLIIGFAACNNAANRDILQLKTSGSTPQITFAVGSNRDIKVYRGSNIVGTLLYQTANNVLPAYNTWKYFEFKVRLGSGTSGSIEMLVDGVQTINLPAVNTVASGTPTVFTAIMLGHGAAYDDLYLLNEQGSTNNDYLGDVTVESLEPDGAGDLTQWIPTGGTNWDAVSEHGFDFTDYVYSTTANAEDLYTLQDDTTHTSPYVVAGVVIEAIASKDDTASRSIAISAKQGSSHVQSSDKVLTLDTGGGSGSSCYKHALDSAPSGAAWTFALLNALQAGIVCR